jgi:hypothetical protein
MPPRRGRTYFTLEAEQRVIDRYTGGDKSLKGKIMFPISTPGSGIASILHIDDPVKNATEIADLVKKGYMVRTFADQYNNGALPHGPSLNPVSFVNFCHCAWCANEGRCDHYDDVNDTLLDCYLQETAGHCM